MSSKNLAYNSLWQRLVRSHAFYAWLLIAPAALFLFTIVGWPLIETVRLSFTNAGLGGEEYIGFYNYEKLFSNRKYSVLLRAIAVCLIHAFLVSNLAFAIEIPNNHTLAIASKLWQKELKELRTHKG